MKAVGSRTVWDRGERLNVITHLLGTVLALAGLPLLIFTATLRGTARHVVSFAIFGTTLVLLYLFSTVYHSVRGPAKPVFKKLDCIAIFWLIAGTYTPIGLVTLEGTLGWVLVGTNWGLALAGTINEAIGWSRHRAVSHALYLLMGWLALPAFAPLVRSLGPVGFALIVVGGFFYTGGLIFYVRKQVPHSHGIWHAFVLAGSACHFISVLFFVR